MSGKIEVIGEVFLRVANVLEMNRREDNVLYVSHRPLSLTLVRVFHEYCTAERNNIPKEPNKQMIINYC